MQKLISKSPGEIFFFGEHSVVYGRRAIAAAIDRWVTTTLTANDDYIQIDSGIGRLTAEINGLRLRDVRADKHLEPFVYGIERVFKRFGHSTGFTAVIESELPIGSGLASSAASSASLLGGLIALIDEELSKEDMVGFVFKSELDIQKRGSISGSACTVLGNIVEMVDNNFSEFANTEIEPPIIIADSKVGLLTSESTAWVKRMLDKDKEKTQKIFDSIHNLATEGKGALRNKDWQRLGYLMNINHSYLRQLGVSTDRIDDGIKAINSYVYGSKITGAGGGGCFISICGNENKDRVIEILKDKGFNAYPCRITSVGHHIIR